MENNIENFDLNNLERIELLCQNILSNSESHNDLDDTLSEFSWESFDKNNDSKEISCEQRVIEELPKLSAEEVDEVIIFLNYFF